MSIVIPSAPKGTRILLLDDDAFMLKVLVSTLARIGYADVVGYTNGDQALQEMARPQSQIDLIFLDINMPQMDGVEFIRQLVANRFNGAVVLVSGEHDRVVDSVEKLIKMHRLRVLGTLPKPVSVKKLAALLSHVASLPKTKPAKRMPPAIYGRDELRGAISSGQLCNHYQPKVDMLHGEVVGVECLVRWQRSSTELVRPDQFIDQVAEHGLITDLTLGVLRTALAQVRSWQQTGLTLAIAVNVSMQDITRLDFPDMAAWLTTEAGVDPELVTLEITERQIMKQRSAALDVLSRLRLKRFKLAIDDFGTGHSSLAQLRDLPFDELKVDRGFVHGAAADERRRAICSASLRMAHQLRMHVVAEGVEQEADWHMLQQIGCDACQGYLIAKPMPAAAVPNWISGWETQRRGRVASS